MKHWLIFLPLLGLLILNIGCGQGGPREGDTVKVVLTNKGITWTPGNNNFLRVHLVATNKDGSPSRMLGFRGIPESTNPKMLITFYDGDKAQSPLEVVLSHRC